MIVLLVFQTCVSSLLIVSSIKSHKKYIKKICKELIKQDNYKSNLVVFTEKEIENAIWEHSKEFFLNESKYDVVSTETVNGIKLYHCIDDKKEVELKHKIAEQQSNKLKFDDLLKKMNLSFIHPSKHRQSHSQSFINHIELSNNKYYFLFSGDISKPPKFVTLS